MEIRVASSDIQKGKRSGFRLIYLWKAGEFKVHLLAVYFKGEKEKISKTEIDSLLKRLNKELK